MVITTSIYEAQSRLDIFLTILLLASNLMWLQPSSVHDYLAVIPLEFNRAYSQESMPKTATSNRNQILNHTITKYVSLYHIHQVSHILGYMEQLLRLLYEYML